MYQTIDKLAERKVTSIESLKKAGIAEKQLVDWLLANRSEFMKKRLHNASCDQGLYG